MQNYLLAIDAGTGSARAVIFNTLGEQISIAQEEWSHISDENISGSMNFDFKLNWQLIARCIKKAIKIANIEPMLIKAVSATSMREGIVLYDNKNEELWAIANVDSRSAKEVKWIKENYPHLEENFYKTSGQTFALGALPRLLWVKNNLPNIYEKTTKISMISDWVLTKLSNEIISEPSNAGTTGAFSLKNRSWEPSMAKELGLKDDIFPKCVETGTIIGKVTQKAAIETGLKEGTFVVTGGGDVQLGSVGLGVVKAGDSAILGGTFWQQIVNINSNKTHPTMNLRVNPHVINGLNQVEGITFFTGLIMRWFRDVFCQEEKNQAIIQNCDPYYLLEKLAQKIPLGSNGIIPIFSDQMKYGNWYHASPSFLNLSIDSNICNKGSMFRSLQENAAIVSSINIEQIEKFTDTSIDTLVFAGGASKGFLWPQILADVSGKCVKIPVVKEATALATSFAAGVGCKIFKDLTEASSLVKWDKTIEPNLENHKQYAKVRNKWENAYSAQMRLVDQNITKSMWKAPGL